MVGQFVDMCRKRGLKVNVGKGNLPFPFFILMQLFTFPPFVLFASFQNKFQFSFTSSFIFHQNFIYCLSFATSSLVSSTTFQAISFLSTVAFTSSFHHTLLSFFLLPFSLRHTSPLHCQSSPALSAPTYAQQYFLHPTLLSYSQEILHIFLFTDVSSASRF